MRCLTHGWRRLFYIMGFASLPRSTTSSATVASTAFQVQNIVHMPTMGATRDASDHPPLFECGLVCRHTYRRGSGTESSPRAVLSMNSGVCRDAIQSSRSTFQRSPQRVCPRHPPASTQDHTSTCLCTQRHRARGSATMPEHNAA